MLQRRTLSVVHRVASQLHCTANGVHRGVNGIGARALFSSDAPMTDVRGNHKFDEKLLCQYLNSKGLSGFANNTMTVKQFSHGQSNPSFMIADANGKRFTVRKQPAGKLLPGAHAVDREYQVMTALKKSNVAVPATRLYCEDPSVLGSPFFVYGE